MKRKSSNYYLLLTLIALPFVGSVKTYAQVGFTVQVSDRQVVQNGIFDIQFELSNAQGSSFQPPSFSDFKIVGGPSRGQSTTIINGAVTSSETYSYSLLATKKGKYTIGSASIVAGSKKFTTKPITIEVVQGREITRQGNTSQSPVDVILEAETEKKDYYPGEQIILNYRILFNQNIQSVDILAEDDYADFFVQNFSEFSKQPAIVKLNGKEYTSRIIKSIALYPHQSGTYVIDPLVMSVGINAPFSGIQGFFTMRRMQDVRIASDSLKINVLPLPPGEPATFHGAVGQYTMKTYPGSQDITTDDALTFQVELRGNGDAKRWDPPTVVADSIFESYDPKITDDQQLESGGIIENRRSIEYQLIPKTAGTYKAWVPFTYFDPDTKQYVTLTSDTLHVQVAQGTNKGKRSIAINENEITQFEIDPVRRSILNDRFWISWPHWLLFSLVITGSCWGFVHASKSRKEEQISQKEKARNVAAAHAVSQLDELLKTSSSLDTKTYYERVTEVFYRFLCHRLMIPSSDLDEVKLPGHLQLSRVNDDICTRVMKLYQACLPVRYGGAPAGFSREEFVEECKGIIRDL